MSVHSNIEQQLLTGLRPHRMQLINESHQHNVPEGSESHFNLVIVSDAFVGKSLVQRHRAVYATLGDTMRQQVHALTMKTLTLEEWEQAGGEVTNPAPPCLGGGKKRG